VANTDELLAATAKMVQIRTADGSLRASVDANAKRALAAGKPALVQGVASGKPIVARLLPNAAIAAPAQDQYIVTDLPAFLVAPAVASQDGRMIPVSLRAKNIRDLRERGITQFHVGNRAVTVRSVMPTENHASAIYGLPAVVQHQKEYPKNPLLRR